MEQSGVLVGPITRRSRGSNPALATYFYYNMQTFLPYTNFEKTFRVLDSKRLGKQRVEAYQILNILLNRTSTKAWRNHPAVKMWKGYENALKLYFNECVKEWKKRGFQNNMKLEIIRCKIIMPFWMKSRKFHASHRSNLLRKDKIYYSKFKWKEVDNLPYVWPVD